MKSKKILFKLIFDLLMFITLMILYSKNVISMSFHEIAGLAVLVAMLVHVLINGNWVKAVTGKLFQKDFSVKQKVNWIVDFLELLTVLGMIVSSLLINKTLISSIGNHNSMKPLHFFLAALLLVLVGIHLGLHFSYIKGAVAGNSKKMTVPVKVVLICLALAVSGFGCYNTCTTGFSRWIKSPFVSTSMQKGGKPDFKSMPEFKTQEGFSGEKPDMSKMKMQGHPQAQSFSFSRLLTLFAKMGSIALMFGSLAFAVQSLVTRRKNRL